ncbi:MAG: type II toxin-antitoxin system Phd/YefM family antitoxin [Thermodesulfovibrionales bacterium]
MGSVGVRELKAQLSRYIDAVRRGQPVIVTEHGEEVAVINPISEERRAIAVLVREGKVHWAGGKPEGLKGMRVKGELMSKTVLRERS